MIKIMKRLYKIYKRNRFIKNLAFLCASVFILASAMVLIWLSSLKIPDFNSFEERKVVNSIRIYDRTGEVMLYDIHRETKRTDISFEEMGKNIKNATVAIEDSEFY